MSNYEHHLYNEQGEHVFNAIYIKGKNVFEVMPVSNAREVTEYDFEAFYQFKKDNNLMTKSEVDYYGARNETRKEKDTNR